MRVAAIITLILMLAGCSQSPVMDTSSDISMKQSLEQVRESLPAGKRKIFDDAIEVVMLRHMYPDKMPEKRPHRMPPPRAAMLIAIHGMNGETVIAEAGRIQDAYRAQQKQDAIAEITALKEKKASRQQITAQLQSFRIVSAQLVKQYRVGAELPVIELRVRNETGKPVSRAKFTGTVSSSRYRKALLIRDFNHEPAGPLAAGAEASWQMVQNPYSEWGRVPISGDTYLNVTVQQLYGPDGKSLFGDDQFTAMDQKRLNELLAIYPGY